MLSRSCRYGHLEAEGAEEQTLSGVVPTRLALTLQLGGWRLFLDDTVRVTEGAGEEEEERVGLRK